MLLYILLFTNDLLYNKLFHTKAIGMIYLNSILSLFDPLYVISYMWWYMFRVWCLFIFAIFFDLVILHLISYLVKSLIMWMLTSFCYALVLFNPLPCSFMCWNYCVLLMNISCRCYEYLLHFTCLIAYVIFDIIFQFCVYLSLSKI